MIKTWKGKPIDFLLAFIYFILYSCVVTIQVAIKHSIKYDTDVILAIKNPNNYLFSFCFLFFFMSPVWVYFRKVPKLLKIDVANRKMEIHKRKRTLKYNLDKIRFYQRKTIFFFILEIHATFESSRNGEFEKLATSIIVPNWGMSWNKRKMEEIVEEFRTLDIEEIKNRPLLKLSEYFYN